MKNEVLDVVLAELALHGIKPVLEAWRKTPSAVFGCKKGARALPPSPYRQATVTRGSPVARKSAAS